MAAYDVGTKLGVSATGYRGAALGLCLGMLIVGLFGPNPSVVLPIVGAALIAALLSLRARAMPAPLAPVSRLNLPQVAPVKAAPLQTSEQPAGFAAAVNWVLTAKIDTAGTLISASAEFLRKTGCALGQQLPIAELAQPPLRQGPLDKLLVLQPPFRKPISLAVWLAQDTAARGDKKQWILQALEVPNTRQTEGPVTNVGADGTLQGLEEIERGLRLLTLGEAAPPFPQPMPPQLEPLRVGFNGLTEKLNQTLAKIALHLRSVQMRTEPLAPKATRFVQKTQALQATCQDLIAKANAAETSMAASTRAMTEAKTLLISAHSEISNSQKVRLEANAAFGLLTQPSGQIAAKLKTIEAIAFQSNLLALNAGVEAARAGDTGRGFAVVAAEMRALAQRSSVASQEISQLVTQNTARMAQGIELIAEFEGVLGRSDAALQQATTGMKALIEGANTQLCGVSNIHKDLNQVLQGMHVQGKEVQSLRSLAAELAGATALLQDVVVEAFVLPAMEPSEPLAVEHQPNTKPAPSQRQPASDRTHSGLGTSLAAKNSVYPSPNSGFAQQSAAQWQDF